MLMHLDGTGALYQQIYQALRRAILGGRLAAATRLPATRALARDLGVSRNTVLLAYDQLLAEGYTVGHIGSGTYVATTLPDTTLTLSPTGQAASPHALAEDLPLSAYGQRAHATLPFPPPGVPPSSHAIRYDFRYGLPASADFPHAVWRRLLTRCARTMAPEDFGYGSPQGYTPLRQTIAEYLHRARGVLCTPEQIIVVNGSQQALDLVIRVLVDVGAQVVIEEPHYQGARQVLRAAGATLLPVPVDAEGLVTTQLPAPHTGVRLAYVTPSHQFPTGAIMSLSRRLALLAWAEQTGAYVIEDDYDSEYRYEGRPVEAVQGLDRGGRVIYIGTFSKVLFPALRLGYLVLPPLLVPAVMAAKWLTDRHTSTFEQAVLTAFIQEGHFERHLRRSRTRYAARRAALLAALTAFLGEQVEVSGANAGAHLLVWLQGIASTQVGALIEAVAQTGVGVYAVTPYYLSPPARAGLLLGYAAMTESDISIGIRCLATVLRQHTSRWAEAQPTVSPVGRALARQSTGEGLTK